MSKVMRLTERDLTKLVSRIINEQPVGVPYGSKKTKLPIDTKLWKMLEDELTGEGPSIIKETPNQLIIDGLSGTWTITLTR
jgi:hypothetical protein